MLQTRAGKVFLVIYGALLVLAVTLGIHAVITNARQDRELLWHIHNDTDALVSRNKDLDRRLECVERKIFSELEAIDIDRANKNLGKEK